MAFEGVAEFDFAELDMEEDRFEVGRLPWAAGDDEFDGGVAETAGLIIAVADANEGLAVALAPLACAMAVRTDDLADFSKGGHGFEDCGIHGTWMIDSPQ